MSGSWVKMFFPFTRLILWDHQSSSNRASWVSRTVSRRSGSSAELGSSVVAAPDTTVGLGIWLVMLQSVSLLSGPVPSLRDPCRRTILHVADKCPIFSSVNKIFICWVSIRNPRYLILRVGCNWDFSRLTTNPSISRRRWSGSAVSPALSWTVPSLVNRLDTLSGIFPTDKEMTTLLGEDVRYTRQTEWEGLEFVHFSLPQKTEVFPVLFPNCHW